MMTPEDRIDAIERDTLHVFHVRGKQDPADAAVPAVRSVLRRHLAEVLAAERAACALTAEAWARGETAHVTAADAIRARP